MPSKRYRLKLEHPYAKAGTIVEERGRDPFNDGDVYLISTEGSFNIPISAENDWLEEVKEPTCSKEFAQWLSDCIDSQDLTKDGIKYLLLSHTAKEE